LSIKREDSDASRIDFADITTGKRLALIHPGEWPTMALRTGQSLGRRNGFGLGTMQRMPSQRQRMIWFRLLSQISWTVPYGAQNKNNEGNEKDTS